MALSIICCICLFHHLPSVFCIRHILYTYYMRQNKSLILSNLCGTNIWTLRIKSKIPIGIELKSKVSPDFIMPSFLLNISVFFPHFCIIFSCIIDMAVGTYAMFESVSSLGCEEKDWTCVKCFYFQIWCRSITYTKVLNMCFLACAMGATLSKNTLEVYYYHVVY